MQNAKCILHPDFWIVWKLIPTMFYPLCMKRKITNVEIHDLASLSAKNQTLQYGLRVRKKYRILPICTIKMLYFTKNRQIIFVKQGRECFLRKIYRAKNNKDCVKNHKKIYRKSDMMYPYYRYVMVCDLQYAKKRL